MLQQMRAQTMNATLPTMDTVTTFVPTRHMLKNATKNEAILESSQISKRVARD
jgi:hypothetical protein